MTVESLLALQGRGVLHLLLHLAAALHAAIW